MEEILRPLKELSHSGFEHGGCNLFPLFFCYVHDYPEGAKVPNKNPISISFHLFVTSPTSIFVFVSQVSGTYGSGKCNFPCNSCMVEKENVNKFDKKFTTREHKEMKKIVAMIEAAGEGLHEKDKKRKQKDVMTLHSAYPAKVITSYSFMGAKLCLNYFSFHSVLCGNFAFMIQTLVTCTKVYWLKLCIKPIKVVSFSHNSK